MITKKVIDSLYKKYNSRPGSPDELNFGLLFDFLLDNHGISLDENYLIVNSLPADSPFHRIPLRNIHEIVEFGDDIAVVLHSSIVILSKHNSKVHIHIRPVRRSPLAGLFSRFTGAHQ